MSSETSRSTGWSTSPQGVNIVEDRPARSRARGERERAALIRRSEALASGVWMGGAARTGPRTAGRVPDLGEDLWTDGEIKQTLGSFLESSRREERVLKEGGFVRRRLRSRGTWLSHAMCTANLRFLAASIRPADRPQFARTSHQNEAHLRTRKPP